MPTVSPLSQRGAALRHVWEQLSQDPSEDALVRRWTASSVAPLVLDVLVDVSQGRLQCFVNGLFGLGSAPPISPATAAPPRGRGRALFLAERHWADQVGQLGHRLLGLWGLSLGVAAAAALAWRSLELLARSLSLVAKHGREACVGGGAAPFAGADEVAVLVALALADALVNGVVVVVTEVVVVVVVVDCGATHALGGG